MKVWLLYPDREYEQKNGYAKKEDIIKDLNFHIIFKMMSREDEFFYQTASRVMMKPLLTKRDIEYRHGMMKDCLKCREEFMQIYDIARTARSEERRVGKECRIGCRSRWSPYH